MGGWMDGWMDGRLFNGAISTAIVNESYDSIIALGEIKKWRRRKRSWPISEYTPSISPNDGGMENTVCNQYLHKSYSFN